MEKSITNPSVYDLDDLSLNDLYRLKRNIREWFIYGQPSMDYDAIKKNVELELQIATQILKVERKNRDVLLGKKRS